MPKIKDGDILVRKGDLPLISIEGDLYYVSLNEENKGDAGLVYSSVALDTHLHIGFKRVANIFEASDTIINWRENWNKETP